MEKRAVKERSRIQNGLHAPKYTPFHKALKEISDFETFPTYLLSTFVFLGRSVERMCSLQRGLERKEQSGRGECSEHWKCRDTSVKSWPFWRLLASPQCRVRASTITFQPLHRLQHSSNFFIISGLFFFSLHHDGTWADNFRQGCKQRKRTSAAELLNSC